MKRTLLSRSRTASLTSLSLRSVASPTSILPHTTTSSTLSSLFHRSQRCRNLTNAPTPSAARSMPPPEPIKPLFTTPPASTASTTPVPETPSTTTTATATPPTATPGALGLLAGDAPSKARYEWHEFTWPKAIAIGLILYSPYYYFYNNNVQFKEEADYWLEDGWSDLKAYIVERFTPADVFITEADIQREDEAELIRAEIEREQSVDLFLSEYPDPEEEAKTTWQKFKDKAKAKINFYSPIGDIFEKETKPTAVVAEGTELPVQTSNPTDEPTKS